MCPASRPELLALARAHDLLTKRHWESAPLGSLAGEVLAPLTGELGERVVMIGPNIEINPRAALSITMVLNELATNALKHGALSGPAGNLAIVWQLSDEDNRATLQLSWQERGGPPVSPPQRRGFGTRLIERCIEADLGGVIDLSFDPTGVNCHIAFPLGPASG